MPCLSPAWLVENLRETNSRLGFWLENLLPDQTLSSARPRTATPQQMTGILSELMRAGEWLRQLPPDKDPDLERELSDYRRKVERLRDLLPLIHNALLQERARLEQQRARVESAAEWARRSRQTL
ncbi:MAG TPA: hypothetical protein VEH47_04890 [Candidatus Acidoferrales bacterium]|nr:hypothetical protein [Candidatus Acidoferrales bacterium]